MAKMLTHNKDTPKGRSVLLFSGGMDSLIFDFLLKPDILLVINHGNKYEKQEQQSIDQLCIHNYIDGNKLVFDSSFDLSKFERDDVIIPSRNLYFIVLAANYGETIYIGSVSGDRTLDKSTEFLNRCQEILDYLYQEQHWCIKRDFIVSSPFKHMTKTELVSLFLQKGGNKLALLTSRSCYESSLKPCGWCKSCFRKWVALKNNKIDIYDYFENNPELAPWLPQLLPLIDKDEYRGKEDNDIKNALGLSY